MALGGQKTTHSGLSVSGRHIATCIFMQQRMFGDNGTAILVEMRPTSIGFQGTRLKRELSP